MKNNKKTMKNNDKKIIIKLNKIIFSMNIFDEYLRECHYKILYK